MIKRCRHTGVVEVGLVASNDVSWVGRHDDLCERKEFVVVVESVL
jgi:hypothetical protein